jgi:hypothetical protein
MRRKIGRQCGDGGRIFVITVAQNLACPKCTPWVIWPMYFNLGEVHSASFTIFSAALSVGDVVKITVVETTEHDLTAVLPERERD